MESRPREGEAPACVRRHPGVSHVQTTTTTTTTTTTKKKKKNFLTLSISQVLSIGEEPSVFTLDPSLGEFVLTQPRVRLPPRGTIFSINEGNTSLWDAGTAAYVKSCKFPADGGKPKSARYVGSMVADVHRTLLYGGVFLYPADTKSTRGKLRLLYECYPMAYVLERAGGRAVSGSQAILDIHPGGIHERCPIFLGSADDVADVEAAIAADAASLQI